jgi:hypothetical protein
LFNKSFIREVNKFSMQDAAAYDLINHGDHSQEESRNHLQKHIKKNFYIFFGFWISKYFKLKKYPLLANYHIFKEKSSFQKCWVRNYL